MAAHRRDLSLAFVFVLMTIFLPVVLPFVPINHRAIQSPARRTAALFELFSLTDEQDEAIRSFGPVAVEKYGFSWFRSNDEAIQEARDTYPVLADLTKEEIREAYLKQNPTVLDVFTQTPLGPFLLINIVAYLADFSWCDTPFGNSDICGAL